MIISELAKILNDFYHPQLNDNLQFDNNKNMLNVFEQMFGNFYSQQEINIFELSQFFNKALYFEILNTPASNANYKNLCVLVNHFFNQPTFKDATDLLTLLQDLLREGNIPPILLKHISTHPDPVNFIKACLLTKNENLYDTLYQGNNPLMTAEALQQAEIYNFTGTIEEKKLFILHKKPKELSNALIKYIDFSQKSNASFAIDSTLLTSILHHENPIALVNTVIALNNERITLTEEQRATIISLKNPELMIENIINADLLEKYFILPRIKINIMTHSRPKKLISSLLLLYHHQVLILTEEDFDKIIHNKNFSFIVDLIIQLKNTNIMLLDRSNIEKILAHQNPLLAYQEIQKIIEKKNDLNEIDIDNIYKKTNIPPKRLSLKYFDQAYNHRDVMGLKKLREWRTEDEEINLELNRILQPSFMYRDPKKILFDAKTVNFAWLTDCCCPSVTAALILHIAKEMVVNYKIKETDLNVVTHKIYESMIVKFPSLISNLENVINEKIAIMLQPNGILDKEVLETLATKMCEKNDIKNITPAIFEAAKRLAIDIERNKITNELISEEVKNYLVMNESQLNIEKKPVYPIYATKDYSFLGAAGSGKSTIALEYFNKEKKTNYIDYIRLSTDIYRVITLPNTKAHEKNQQKMFS